MTKIDIFSGFLGAGKTTLIKKLLKEAYAGEKVVLIENEFGEIGIDGGFLADAGIEITEMNSGCICCSLVGDFSKALAKDYGKTNKTLPTLWFERLDSKKMSVDQIQGITNNAIDLLFAEDADKDELQGQLVNVVAAQEAMRQLRESREGFFGFFWKLFNRDLNAKEEEYMNSLTAAVSELRTGGYDVDTVRHELTG